MDKSFLGRGWSFPPEFRQGTEPTVMVAEDDDIRQSLEILLKTAPGERVHRYDFGCGIRRFVHEGMSLTIQTEMRDVIERAILMFEPRIGLDEVDMDMSGINEGVVRIRLSYTIRQTNTRSNMVFPFYLDEGTELY